MVNSRACTFHLPAIMLLAAVNFAARAAESPMKPAAAHRSPPAYEGMARDVFSQLVGVDSTHGTVLLAAVAIAARQQAGGQ